MGNVNGGEPLTLDEGFLRRPPPSIRLDHRVTRITKTTMVNPRRPRCKEKPTRACTYSRTLSAPTSSKSRPQPPHELQQLKQGTLRGEHSAQALGGTQGGCAEDRGLKEKDDERDDHFVWKMAQNFVLRVKLSLRLRQGHLQNSLTMAVLAKHHQTVFLRHCTTRLWRPRVCNIVCSSSFRLLRRAPRDVVVVRLQRADRQLQTLGALSDVPHDDLLVDVMLRSTSLERRIRSVANGRTNAGIKSTGRIPRTKEGKF